MTQSSLQQTDIKAVSVDEISDADYEVLRRLLTRYEPDISLEKAKRIGNFILRIHMLVNKDLIGKQNYVEIDTGGIGNDRQQD